jgi:pimeloyl-ACP methyl ester carboxylesterase
MAVGALIAGPPEAPLVGLIHGLAGSRRVWDRVLPLIEPHARVHALDLTGSTSIEQQADQAAELIPGPAVLVGHSRGGLVATAIAERHPGLASKLMLLCAPWAPESRLSANRRAERALAIPAIGQLLWALATEARQRQALRTAFAPDIPIPDQFVADLRRTGRRNLLAASQSIDTYLAETPLAERLMALAVPAELIYGGKDGRVAPPASSALTHTMLPAVGHTPPWEAPDQIAELILAALNLEGLPQPAVCTGATSPAGGGRNSRPLSAPRVVRVAAVSQAAISRT